MNFDYTIVGGGPSGLTIALFLSLSGKSCCLIDKNKSLGGCHRVTRAEGKYFTEHGPRVYSSAYVNFRQILKKLGTSFNELYTPYNFSISNIQGKGAENFSFREKLLIGMEIIKFIFNINTNILKHTSVKNFASKHNFSNTSQDYMDRICRLTDGAGYDKYNMLEFIQLINQNFFYNLYQPKYPNDVKLFNLWEKKLVDNNVFIMKETDVVSYTITNNKYVVNLLNKEQVSSTVSSNNLVLCIPPLHFTKISPEFVLQKFGSYNNLDIKEWADFNSYINDVPVSFHWNTKINIPKVWGFPSSEWGIAFIVLSEYMNTNNNDGVTISTCVTKQDTVSSVTGKTMQQSNEQELIEEVFRQLKLSFPNIPIYDKAIVHPNVKYINNKWIEDDTAYVETYKYQFVKATHPEYKGLYYVGSHNGNSNYNFTSFESAVTNALHALNKMEGVSTINIKKPFELITLIRWLLIFILVLIILIIIIKKL